MRTLTCGLPVLFVFILLFFVLPPATRADEIVITNGTVLSSVHIVDPTFSFGNQAQGFNMAGSGNGTGVSGFVFACQPCVDGTINASRTFDGRSLGSGPATVGGVSYESIYYTGTVSFSMPSFVIQDRSPTSIIEVPFTMTGNVIGSINERGQPPVIFTTTLSGHGIATFVFSNGFRGTTWSHNLESVTLNFSPDPAPVPEPATLILFGTGLAAVAARYRRRRR